MKCSLVVAFRLVTPISSVVCDASFSNRGSLRVLLVLPPCNAHANNGFHAQKGQLARVGGAASAVCGHRCLEQGREALRPDLG
jgi:hypothetical protein